MVSGSSGDSLPEHGFCPQTWSLVKWEHSAGVMESFMMTKGGGVVRCQLGGP